MNTKLHQMGFDPPVLLLLGSAMSASVELAATGLVWLAISLSARRWGARLWVVAIASFGTGWAAASAAAPIPSLLMVALGASAGSVTSDAGVAPFGRAWGGVVLGCALVAGAFAGAPVSDALWLAAPAALLAALLRARANAREGDAEPAGLEGYELLEQIGAGQMGEVWRAHHRLLERPVAIKLVRAEEELSGSLRETEARFEREAKAIAQLRSPHTVELYDFGMEPDGSFFYAMELLDGFDLGRMVRRFGPLSVGRTACLLRQGCSSIAEAHAAGLVHRDLKPENLFVARQGLEEDFLKVLDFGLVTGTRGAGGTLTTRGQILGTPAYMAPEVALGRDVDGRSDVYSIGCIAYWCLAGHPPFDGDHVLTLIEQHATAPRDPVSLTALEEVPSALDELLLRCIHPNPQERPSALELEASLRPWGAVWTREQAQTWWAKPARLSPA